MARIYQLLREAAETPRETTRTPTKCDWHQGTILSAEPPTYSVRVMPGDVRHVVSTRDPAIRVEGHQVYRESLEPCTCGCTE